MVAGEEKTPAEHPVVGAAWEAKTAADQSAPPASAAEAKVPAGQVGSPATAVEARAAAAQLATAAGVAAKQLPEDQAEEAPPAVKVSEGKTMAEQPESAAAAEPVAAAVERPAPRVAAATGLDQQMEATGFERRGETARECLEKAAMGVG